MLEQCNESISEPVYKKSDKSYCSNFLGISLLSSTYSTKNKKE
jgi:hypothetical protein